MIPFDFEYYKPDTYQEALSLYQSLHSQGKTVLYYGGGTEVISFSSLYQLHPQALIDIKGIPECAVLEFQNDRLIIGAAKTLAQLQEANFFPLLSQCGGRVADHTIRNKITLGGNICSQLPFREGILALLVSDCEVVIAGADGVRREPLNQIYTQSLQLKGGDLLLQFIVEKKYTGLPFYSMKKTANGDVAYPQNKIGYPLLSSAFVKKDGLIRAAFSGLCPFPFRLASVDNALNDKTGPTQERLEKVVKLLPADILHDLEGSAAYRTALLGNTLSKAFEGLEGAESLC
ncbi:MAG: FAD binding domain-containing protein [Clostridia bacterium]|jgi:CO/xanthine dehydrogenase FAD-binding subunit|nr:FAD binding domain-containing protein [Clostridia bacterium]